jgi:tRNA pseudouridine55 synthase
MKHRKGRPLNGILLLNKPIGMSSNGALQQVKRLYNAQKAGHTGSLDPLATGMLPLCFGEATKLSQYLLDADKHYQVTGTLGIKTTTADAEGEIISERAVNVTEEKLESVLTQFRGIISQIPSMFSALKHNGKPLYELARQGIEIERKPREVRIDTLELLKFELPFISLDVKCSKGTYVRNLIEDIGEALDCGAHVSQLHRVSAGFYQSNQMVELNELIKLAEAQDFQALDALLLPLESVIEHLPLISLPSVSAFQLQQGNSVQVFNQECKGLVKIAGPRGNLIGVGEINEEGLLAPQRILKTSPKN